MCLYVFVNYFYISNNSLYTLAPNFDIYNYLVFLQLATTLTAFYKTRSVINHLACDEIQDIRVICESMC